MRNARKMTKFVQANLLNMKPSNDDCGLCGNKNNKQICSVCSEYIAAYTDNGEFIGNFDSIEEAMGEEESF